MPYDPGDVVEVQRGPRPGAAAGTYRAFAATLRGLKMTMGRLAEGPIAKQVLATLPRSVKGRPVWRQ